MKTGLSWGSSDRGASDSRRPTVPRTPRSWRVTFAALLACIGWAAPAMACPNCAVGREARSEVWNRDFAFNLAVALLPFLLIGSICVRVEATDGRVLALGDGEPEDSASPGVSPAQPGACRSSP